MKWSVIPRRPPGSFNIWVTRRALGSFSSSSSGHNLPKKSFIKIRNSLQEGENDLPLTGGDVLKWYACGPTVYDVAHLGHARTYIHTDILRRVLADHFRVPLTFAMGMTDVDDKIIRRSKSEGDQNDGWLTVARKYEKLFLADLDALNIRRPDAILRVTEHMEDIKDYITNIIRAGKAYKAPSGVYFSVSQHEHDKNASYGKLGSIPSSDSDESQLDGQDKKDLRDFALWKCLEVDRGEPTWQSPWGAGRPGWHIECSAMTQAHFGNAFDIHSGGIDLRFPHHTNEIAQCEAHNMCDHWVKFWMHTGHLYIDGLKMSKSLKNFISVEDYLSGAWLNDTSTPKTNSFVQRADAADDLRIFFLHHKYHSSLHFSKDRINESAIWRRKILSTLEAIRTLIHDDVQLATEVSRPRRMCDDGQELLNQLSMCKRSVDNALMNDFDTPDALFHLTNLCSKANVYALGAFQNPLMPLDPLSSIEEYVVNILSMFGLTFPSRIKAFDGNEEVQSFNTNIIGEVVDLRFKMRKMALQHLSYLKKIERSENNENDAKIIADKLSGAKQFPKDVLEACDKTRDNLLQHCGIEVKDYADRSRWHQKE